MVQLMLFALFQISASGTAAGATCVENPQITIDVHAVSESSRHGRESMNDEIIAFSFTDTTTVESINATYPFRVTLSRRDGTMSERPLEVDGPLTTEQVTKILPTFRPQVGESYWLLNLRAVRSIRQQDDVAVFSYSYTRYGHMSNDVYKNCNERVTQELRTEVQP